MTLLQPDFLPNRSETFQAFRYLLQQLEGIQPGVAGATDFGVSQRAAGANMSVDVAVGDAWVKGSGTRQGLYHSVNDAVVNAVVLAADASNPRVDQLLLVIYDSSISGSADQASLVVVPGTATSGATLSNRTGAVADGTLTTTYSNWIRLADILVPAASSSVVNANLRDRRLWSRGARSTITRTANAAAGTDYTTAATTMAAIDTTNLQPRIECSGVPLRLRLLGQASHSVANALVEVGFAMDGVLVDGITEAGLGWQTILPVGSATPVRLGTLLEWETIPTVGSHQFAPWWDTVTAGTFTLKAATTVPLRFVLEEIIRQDANNGLT